VYVAVMVSLTATFEQISPNGSSTSLTAAVSETVTKALGLGLGLSGNRAAGGHYEHESESQH